MIYLDNPHAKRVVEVTAQLWLHIPISFGMVRVEDSKHMTIDRHRYALPVMQSWIRVNPYQSKKELKCGKKPIERP